VTFDEPATLHPTNRHFLNESIGRSLYVSKDMENLYRLDECAEKVLSLDLVASKVHDHHFAVGSTPGHGIARGPDSRVVSLLSYTPSRRAHASRGESSAAQRYSGMPIKHTGAANRIPIFTRFGQLEAKRLTRSA